MTGIALRRRFVLPLAALLLASCAIVRGLEALRVDIGGGLSIDLPATPHAVRPFSAAQSMLLSFGEKTVLLSIRIRSDGDTLHLAAVDGLGRRALTATWMDGQINARLADWLPATLPATALIADIFLTHWPAESVEQALARSGGTLRVGDGQRIITRDGTEIVRIDHVDSRESPWSSTTHYSNLARGYSIEIVSTELEE